MVKDRYFVWVFDCYIRKYINVKERNFLMGDLLNLKVILKLFGGKCFELYLFIC